MSYWTVIPTVIRRTKRITAEEKELWYEIYDRVNAGGYCTASNEELAKSLGVSVKTITTRLTALRAKKFANVYLNLHNHKRLIYLNIPGQPSAEKKPVSEELQERTRNFQESLKKAIVFGTIDFNVLIEKLKESPYLEEVEDNTTQFILSSEQIEFLTKFQKRYPGKSVDCQVACYPSIDYKALIKAIEESFFMQDSNNLSLKWCLTHSDEILSGKYKTYFAPNEYKKGFKGREYQPNELNSLFQDIDDLIV